MLTYKGYTGEVQVDQAARLFTGRVIGIFDVIHFQGRNYEELERSFQNAVDDYLEGQRESREELLPPQKPGVRDNLSLRERQAFLQLPLEQRRAILEQQASELASYYHDSHDWQDHGEGDFLDY